MWTLGEGNNLYFMFRITYRSSKFVKKCIRLWWLKTCSQSTAKGYDIYNRFNWIPHFEWPYIWVLWKQQLLFIILIIHRLEPLPRVKISLFSIFVCCLKCFGERYQHNIQWIRVTFSKLYLKRYQSFIKDFIFKWIFV